MRTNERDQDVRHVDARQPESMFYWLTPAPAEYTACLAWVESLAELFGGPTFAPHVTLYAGRFSPGDDADSVLERAAAGVAGPVVLRASGLQFSDSFTKCCYIQFEPDEAAERLAAAFKSLVSAPDGYRFNPHLSLFYGRLSAAARERIRGMIQPPQEMAFEAVCAVAGGAEVKTRGDVEAWRVVAARPLNPAAFFLSPHPPPR
jgi:hypothetical protein